MSKYNWKELEKEYILGDYKSINSFFKEKGISRNKTSINATKDWKHKKTQKETKMATKTIEKAIEKISEKEAEKIANVKDTANALLEKINTSISELDRYIAKTTTKTKKVTYDYKTMKPSEEITTEESVVNEYKAIIDRFGLKQLASALKDINDILNDDNNSSNGKKVVIVNDLPR